VAPGLRRFTGRGPRPTRIRCIRNACSAGQNYGCTADRVSGCVTFKPAGDKFEICDGRADNYSVVARYRYNRYTKRGYAVNSYGPWKWGGCYTDVENGRGAFKFQVCLADFARPGGRPMRIHEHTCGGWQFTSFGR
jgi:hypothetical protein